MSTHTDNALLLLKDFGVFDLVIKSSHTTIQVDEAKMGIF